MTLEELMNIQVTTAARTPEKIGDIPASVVLITRKDIETFGYRTLEEILENIPGLYAINDYGEEGVNFGVRGFWSGVANDNMIILVNNVPQVDDFHSNYPITKIPVPVEAIDRIEVIRGPMSVIYGNGAFYGVINIFTNDFTKGDSEISDNDADNIISASYGSNNTQKLFLRTSGNMGDLNYVFNASIYESEGMDHPLNKLVTDPSSLGGFGIEADYTTGGKLEENKKYVNFHGDFKNFHLDFSHMSGENEIYFFLPSISEGTLNRLEKTNISFGYTRELSDSFRLNGKFSYTQSRLWEDYDFVSPAFFGIQQLESSGWEMDVNAFITASPELDIKTGLHYRSVTHASNFYDLPSFGAPSFVNNYFYLADGDAIETRAFYTQLSYTPFTNLSLIAGLRFEQMPKYSLGAYLAAETDNGMIVSNTYDQDKVEIIPRFAAIFHLNERNIFKLLYGQAINRPSFFQNTQNLLLEPSKGPLQPESIETFELNYISSLSANFTLNISLFRNQLKNLVTRVSGRDENGEYITWSANEGKLVTNGIEVTFNVEPISNFRLELSGTFQDTQNKQVGIEDIDVAYSPNFLGYIKASYMVRNFTLAFTGNYVGSMETFWDESIGDQGGRIADSVESYFLLGANVRLENIFNSGLYLNVRCSNLLGEDIRYPTYTNNTWADKGTLGIARTFLLTLGWKF